MLLHLIVLMIFSGNVKAVEDDDEIEFELNYGINKINFNNNEIIIDYQKEVNQLVLLFC